jgi:hypothetical protein
MRTALLLLLPYSHTSRMSVRGRERRRRRRARLHPLQQSRLQRVALPPSTRASRVFTYFMTCVLALLGGAL